MTNPTFPVAPLAGRTLKWAADGSETLINSECDPDLVAAQACQSAAAAVEAAVSTKTAAFASGAKAAEAAGSAAQAAASATLATTKAAEAACSVTAVTTVVDEAVTAAANAAQSAAQAEGQALSAAAYAATATGAASQVTAAASQAADAAISASNAADAAAASATQAAGSTTSATGAANTATTAVTTATAAAESAVQAASAAESSAMAAQGSATQASGLATIAINAATEAAGSATQAAAVAVQALDSAQNAADWAVKMDGPVSGGEHSAKWHAASIVGLAGRVRVSDADTTGGFLGAKVVPGALLSVAVDNPGGDERVKIDIDDASLTAFAQEVVGTMIVGAGGTYDGGAGTIALPSDQAILDRLAALETNLAVTQLRDRIDSGGSVLTMVNGWVDAFEDQSGLASLGGATYDATGNYLHNPGEGGGYFQEQTDWVTAWYGGDGPTFAQSFQVSTAAAISKIRFYGWVNSPASTGTFDVRLETDNGGVPSGTLIVPTAKKDGVSVSSQGWVEVTLDAPFTPTVATTYWLRLNTASGTPGWANTNPGNYAPGNAWSNVFGVYPDQDFAFGIFQDSAAVANVTVVAGAVAADTQPAEAHLVILHQPMVAVTLDTDLIVEVSRDGGITWTAAALTHQGAFDASTAILTGTADLSAQPAGTAMKWRMRTLNGKEQRIHGVTLHWR